MWRTIILAILDGWGIGNLEEMNPIYVARPDSLAFIHAHFPGGALQSSGIAVGLPWGEEGNSEVGHLTIGAGKALYQYFPRILLQIQNGEFFKNEALCGAFAHARQHHSTVHLVGLLTKGNVHASLSHLQGLLSMAKREGCERLYCHLWTDGRDSAPTSARELLLLVAREIEKQGVGVIASVVGRYYAMDREGYWDRTERAYNLLVGRPGKIVAAPAPLIEQTYAKGLNDEFVEPAAIGEPHPIGEHDAVIFFNFREDSMRQITEPFLNPAFSRFERRIFQNLFIVTMTRYDERFPCRVAFPPETVDRPLGKILAEAGKTQLRVAETEKYAHVTYFFDGLRDEPFAKEHRVLIPSLNIGRKEEQPEMRARELTERVLAAEREGGFDFILVNYANADAIAHTGNYQATIEAVRVVGQEVGRLLEATLSGGSTLMITADHGNAEAVFDPKTGGPETKHNPNPVPFYLVANEFRRREPNRNPYRFENIGILSDVAPTILELMGIEKPETMTGESLIRQLSKQQ